MKNTIIIFLLLCSIKGFSQVPITRTLSNVNNTADSLKPISKAQATINTSLQSSINTHTANIATNTGNISTNTSNITANSTVISTNTSNIATNTANIATNTANVATNTTDITTKLNKSGDVITGDLGNTATGFFRVASGTTAQRPVSPLNGMLRYNTDVLRNEFYSNGAWRTHARLEGDTFTGNIFATNLSGTNTGDQDLSGYTPLSSYNTLNSTVSTNTANIATNTGAIDLKLDATAISVTNKGRLDFFVKKLYDFNSSPSGKNIGIAWYGDSVAPLVMGEVYMGLGSNYNLNNYVYPFGIRSGITTTVTGIVKYNQKIAGQGYQDLYDGKLSVTSITMVGSIATATISRNHFLNVGDYVTISGSDQTEYNGTYLVASVPSLNTVTFTVTGTPVTPATGTMTAYGGITDFSYLPSASHIELGNGGQVRFNMGNQSGYEKFRLFFARDATSGSVLVELLDQSYTTVISSQTITLSNATTTALFVDITDAIPDAKRNIRITATGKAVVLGCYPLNNNGITAVNFSFGGTTLTQNNYSNDAIFDYIMTNMNVSLISVMAKEESISTSLTPLATRLNRQSNVSKFILGSLPDSSPEAGQRYNNLQFKNLANTNNYAFLDCFNVFGNYQKLVDLGWNGDGTHPVLEANRFVADLIIKDFNLLNTVNTITKKSIDQRFTTNTAILNSVSIASVLPTKSISVIVPYGSGTTALAKLNNIGEVQFGDVTNSLYTKIGGYGNYGVGVFKQDGSFSEMYARSITTQTSAPSSFDALQIRGFDPNLTIWSQVSNQNFTLQTNGGIIRLRTTNAAEHLSVSPNGSVGIANPFPANSAIFDVTSTTKGILLPRMTTGQRDAIITPSEGLKIYNLTTHSENIYNGTVWADDNSYLPLTGGTLTGTSGSGFISFPTQSANPVTPSNGFSLFANSINALSWKGANGFVRTFDGTSNTGDRSYILPNLSGSIPLLEAAQTWSGTNTFNGQIRFGGNIGILTTNPQHPLQVFGTLKVGGSYGQSVGTIVLGDDNSTATNVGLFRGTLAGTVGGGNVLNLNGFDGINLSVGNASFGSQTKALTVFTSTNVGIGTTTDAGYKLDVNGQARSIQYNVSAINTAPTTATSTGTTGEIRFTTTGIYICIATNTWIKCTGATF